jgi:hypothetical protein
MKQRYAGNHQILLCDFIDLLHDFEEQLFYKSTGSENHFKAL